MLLDLLTRILLWALIGWLLWYLLVKFIPKAYLTWLGGAVLLALLVLVFAKPDSEELGVAWRLLSLPLRPLGLSIILLLAAFKDGMKKVNTQQVLTATIILILASLPIITALLVNNLEQSIVNAARIQQSLCQEVCPVDPVLNRGPAGAIVVLNEGTAQSDYAVEPLVQVNQLSELTRSQVTSLIYAAQLYRDQVNATGARPVVIATGGSRAQASGATPEVGRRSERDRIQDFLVSLGVPPEQIQVISTGENVRGTVIETERILDRYATGVARQRVVTVAPALMMRRVGLSFYKEGIQAIAYPTNYYVLEANVPPSGLVEAVAAFIPSADALALTTQATNEYLISIYYFLRDWLPGFDVIWQGPIELDERRLQNL